MNIQVITGNLGADAEIKQVGDNFVIEFRIAHTVKRKGVEPKTDWIHCSYWKDKEEQALALGQYLVKGKSVVVIGEPSVRLYTDKQGDARISQELRVSQLELTGGKAEAEQPAEAKDIVQTKVYVPPMPSTPAPAQYPYNKPGQTQSPKTPVKKQAIAPPVAEDDDETPF